MTANNRSWLINDYDGQWESLTLLTWSHTSVSVMQSWHRTGNQPESGVSFLLQPTMFLREKGEKSGRWPLLRSSHRRKEQKYQDATVDESPVSSPTHTAVQQGLTGVTDFVIYPAASRRHFKSRRERSAFSSHRQVETGWVSSSDLINIRFQLHTGGEAERKIAELNNQQTESINFCLSRLQQRFSAFKRNQSA